MKGINAMYIARHVADFLFFSLCFNAQQRRFVEYEIICTRCWRYSENIVTLKC